MAWSSVGVWERRNMRLSGTHDLAHDVDRDRRVERDIDEVVRRERDVQSGLPLHHQIVDVDGELLAEAVAAGAEDVDLLAVAGGSPPAWVMAWMSVVLPVAPMRPGRTTAPTTEIGLLANSTT